MANLKQGSSGSDVKKLQTALMNAGYDVGTAGADGIFGSKTEAAVKAYQKDNGLVVDGIVGSKTSGSLYGSSNNGNSQTVNGNSQTVKGVNQDVLDKAYNSSFVASDDVNKANDKKNEYGEKLESMANQTDIIDQETLNTINSSFSASSLFNEAMNYTQSLLAKLSSGRTSYTDEVEAMMEKIMNRKDFEYDVDSDQLFQQALASAMNSGKSAMQDTIGQASALTGGYGSTYATSAANQAYNAFIEDAYNNLPEYYQMALQAYQMEGEEMYNQLGMFVDADNREYQRTYDAWSANHANTESIYNREYGQWKDTVDNAYKSANLQLQEHSINFDKLSTVYGMYSDEANTLYNREYQSWADEVSQAQWYAGLLNNDAWNQANQDFQASESQKDRDFQASESQKDRDFQSSESQTNREFQSSESQKDRDFQASESQKDRDFTASENAKNRAVKSSGGSSSSKTGSKSPTSAQINGAKNAYQNGGISGYMDYIESLSDDVNISELDAIVGSETDVGMYYGTYTKTDDTFNWFWGIDNNDKVTDQNGTVFKVKDLPKDVQKMITDAPKGSVVEYDDTQRKWVIR